MARKETGTRDAEATRAAILAAAQSLFQTKGFDAAGVREIAQESGVNASLINRYFGSKEGLFEQAILPILTIEPILQGDKSTFGARVAELFTRTPPGQKDNDITLAFSRSIGSATVGKTLALHVEEQMIGKLADWLGGKNAHQRAGFIMGQLLGFDMLRRVALIDAFSHDNADVSAALLAQSLQRYVDGN